MMILRLVWNAASLPACVNHSGTPRDNETVRDNLTVIGRGSTIVGLLFVLAGASGAYPWLLLAGKGLIGVGIVLLVVHFWKQSRR